MSEKINNGHYIFDEKQSTVKFNKKFYELIIRGEKTQTIRIPAKRWNVCVGDIVTATFPGSNKTLKIRICEIGFCRVNSFEKNGMFKLEGYSDFESLYNDLKSIYLYIHPLDRVYYYRFEVL